MANSHNLKILVIEDNLINQKLASTLFKRLGHEVDLALNGKLGVDMFEKNNYDLILMDIQMPVMTGIEASKSIREIEKRTKAKPVVIIAVTTFNNNSDKDNCLNAGMNGHVSKPYKPIDLLNKVAEHIHFFEVPNQF